MHGVIYKIYYMNKVYLLNNLGGVAAPFRCRFTVILNGPQDPFGIDGHFVVQSRLLGQTATYPPVHHTD